MAEYTGTTHVSAAVVLRRFIYPIILLRSLSVALCVFTSVLGRVYTIRIPTSDSDAGTSGSQADKPHDHSHSGNNTLPPYTFPFCILDTRLTTLTFGLSFWRKMRSVWERAQTPLINVFDWCLGLDADLRVIDW
jgi:hypothetical protein